MPEPTSQDQQQAEQMTVQVFDRVRVKGRKRTSTVKPKHIQVARNIASGLPLGKAMLQAGYSKSVSRNPGQVIAETPALVAAIRAELGHYEFAPAQRSRLIRQRLLKTVLTGNDANANRACELAGKDRDVRLFEPDVSVNILNAYVPAGITELLEPKSSDTSTLDAPTTS
jgi:hypothetical protein